MTNSKPPLLLPILLLIGLVLPAGCATLSGADPGARTPGTLIDDMAVQNLAMRKLRLADERLARANINILSHNGHVLLTGQVPDAGSKVLAQQLVAEMAHVEVVHNELQVAPPTSLATRTNDALLSTRIKTQLLAQRGVPGDRIKVVTEDGVVYLVGIVPRRQADQAVQVTSTVHGVRKIVKVFQYLD